MKGDFSEGVHLVRRFFLSLSRQAPPSDDIAWVQSCLLEGEFGLWSRMSNQDRRHSIMVARRFVDSCPEHSRDHVAAALLHDIGKIESGLGIFGRVVATLAGAHGTRFRAYHEHEKIGLRLCRDNGSTSETLRVLDWTIDDPIVSYLRRADQI